jgi:hypothetical protein
MFFKVKETLKESNMKKELNISFKEVNLYKIAKKYWHIDTIKFSIFMRIMMFFAFNIYTTTSVLYLIDNF